MKNFFLSFLVLTSLSSSAQKKLTVYANKPVAEISPTMWGIFFEDINFGADGGLYAELVKNRSFEFTTPLMGWKEIKQQGNGRILIVNNGNENSANQRYVEVTVDEGSYGISNEGFRGMGIQKNEQYNFSVLARKGDGDIKMHIELVNMAGKKIGEASLSNLSSQWKTSSVSFTTTDTATKGRLNVWLEGKGKVDLDMISLFPQNTWKNRTKGLRKDLVQFLADMKPGFIRFPGGCIVEGRDLSNRYQWKKTVGAVEDRKLIVNRWNTEFKHRLTPDYYQTFGLGFFEYFQLSEDLGAEPLPILNCGMACQYNSGEVVSINDMDPYIQDALDLVEFANGPASSQWGRLRADMGHSEPFHLKYLGIGNEQWDEQYIERYKEFEKVLQQKHPEIKLVAAAGPSPDGPRFDYAWKEFRKLNASLIDEHYYQAPEWFLKNVNRYDNYDRKGPKVFAGEYAAHSKTVTQFDNRNNWECALAEAAFMTGLERNADVVRMSSYAPLFAHVDAWQWTPDLIWFDNLRSYGTPNYYVQKLFATNKGTTAVPLLENGQPLSGSDSIYASSVIDKKRGEVIIKLVNTSSTSLPVTINIEGAKLSQKNAAVEQLYSGKMGVNSLDQPKAVYPVEQSLTIKGKTVAVSLPPFSLTVIKAAAALTK